ncbi:unnamed protein product [Camellia sinensis]
MHLQLASMDTTISIRRWKGPWTRRKTLEAATIGVTLLAAFWVFTATNHRTKLSLQLQGSNACPFPAIFNFDDSNSDTGCVSAVFGRLSPPNGRSFFGKPSGPLSAMHVLALDGLNAMIQGMADRIGNDSPAPEQTASSDLEECNTLTKLFLSL